MASARGYSLLLPSRAADPWTEEPAIQTLQVDNEGRAPVTVHVYSVTGSATVQRVNRVLEKLHTGAFHAAVEVHGKEWSYGYTDSGTGVFCCTPMQCDAHTYLYSLPVGMTPLSQKDVLATIGQMAREWQGEDYDLLRCNCCHFSDELLRRLGLRCLPKQLMNLAGAGAAIGDRAAAVNAFYKDAGAKASHAAHSLSRAFTWSGTKDSSDDDNIPQSSWRSTRMDWKWPQHRSYRCC